MSTTYISFDLETSSSDPNHGEILTLGAVNFHTGEELYLEFKHPFGLWIEPKAIEVNKVSVAQLYRVGTTYEEGDTKVLEWLKRQGAEVKALGLNVGSFDLAFLKGRLPKSSKAFGYRCVDLNSVFESAAWENAASFESIQQQALRRASEWAEKKKPELYHHHALFDCYTNCAAFASVTGRIPEWMAGEQLVLKERQRR